MTDLFDTQSTWIQRDFGLDRRLIKAISKLGFTYPTLVQSKCIPIALQGKDVLVRARTGSGKTLAFALPVLNKILTQKTKDDNSSIKCIMLAPTKELVHQIEKTVNDLTHYCRENLSIVSLTEDNSKVLEYRLQSKPDIVISTPTKLKDLVKKNSIDLSKCNILVVDEADLVLSFGYKQDIQTILSNMPKIFQGIFMSATLSADLDKFKRLVLHQPAILKLEEAEAKGNLLQFYLESTEADKYLILYVFIKLGLLQGKGLIFVNDVNKCYRLKLFLQQFYINSAVLNAEVPLNSRTHIIEEFNRGVFDYLIASDAIVDQGDEDDENDEEDDEEEGEESEDESEEEEVAEEEEEPKKKDNKKSKLNLQETKEKDDYGVSRGVDFQNVSFVVNFDFPKSTAAYTHRIGRTARGMNNGTALSFVTRYDQLKSTSTESKVAERDWEILQDVRSKQPRLGIVEGDNVLAAIGATDAEESEEQRKQPAPLTFNMVELESFRYRVEDTLRSVTQVSVRELRTAEIRHEVLNSEKLKSYFSENPDDLKVLRHDKAILHPIRQKDHLKFVPEYLIPSSMKSVVNMKSTKKRKNKRKNPAGGSNEDTRAKKSKMNDPLYNSGKSQDQNQGEATEVIEYSGKVESNYGRSTAGRKEWKQKHKKGEFNPKLQKKNSKFVPGTFGKKFH